MFLSTGVEHIDNALGGGAQSSQITLVYGEAGSGKTTLALQVTLDACRKKLKTVFAATGRVFPIERFTQLAGEEWRSLMEYCLVNQLQDFEHQDSFVNRLGSYLSPQTKLVVFDSFASLYRASLVPQRSVSNVNLNRLLNKELALLAQISMKKDICVLLTSEMRAVPSGRSSEMKEGGEEAVGMTLLTYWSRAAVKLENTALLNTKKGAVIDNLTGSVVRRFDLSTSKQGIR